MDYVPYNELGESEKKKPGLLVTSTSDTNGRRPNEAVQMLRKNGAKIARVSGWCAFSDWALRGVDAGFPISDHSYLTIIIAYTSNVINAAVLYYR